MVPAVFGRRFAKHPTVGAGDAAVDDTIAAAEVVVVAKNLDTEMHRNQHQLTPECTENKSGDSRKLLKILRFSYRNNFNNYNTQTIENPYTGVIHSQSNKLLP